MPLSLRQLFRLFCIHNKPQNFKLISASIVKKEKDEVKAYCALNRGGSQDYDVRFGARRVRPSGIT